MPCCDTDRQEGIRYSNRLSSNLLLFVSLLSFHLLLVLCHDHQRRSHHWRGPDETPALSVHWSGMSGCLANPTPNTGYEPNFCAYINEEHTAINLPDHNRNFLRRDDATIIIHNRGLRRISTFRSIQQQACRSKQSSHSGEDL